MIDWDLWHTIEELGFAGSYSAAASRLKVNATTVKRRKEQMERLLGRQLFQREAGYLVPTPACKQALDKIRVAGRHLEAAQAELSSELEHSLWRKITITSLNYICDRVLGPGMASLAPDRRLRIELVGGDRNLTLIGGKEADIALRLGNSQSKGVAAWHIADIKYCTYAGKAADGASSPWATLDRAHSHLAEVKIPERHAGNDGVRYTATTSTALEGIVASGAAKAMLPAFIGDQNPNLELLDRHPVIHRPLWLLWRNNVADERHFGAVTTWIVEETEKWFEPTWQATDLLVKYKDQSARR
ncbi:MAG: LysR family transcriptional regulator [Pseudomonadota bacterium]